ANELPSAARYLREHTAGQIASRIGHGLEDMVVRSYRTYWYLWYVVFYTAFAAAVILKKPREFAALVREQRAAFAFVVLYGLFYLIAIAFYEPVSGTGTTRFLLAHLLPYLFVISLFVTREPFSSAGWRIAELHLRARDVHLFVSAMLAFDLIFTIWP